MWQNNKTKPPSSSAHKTIKILSRDVPFYKTNKVETKACTSIKVFIKQVSQATYQDKQYKNTLVIIKRMPELQESVKLKAKATRQLSIKFKFNHPSTLPKILNGFFYHQKTRLDQLEDYTCITTS